MASEKSTLQEKETCHRSKCTELGVCLYIHFHGYSECTEIMEGLETFLKLSSQYEYTLLKETYLSLVKTSIMLERDMIMSDAHQHLKLRLSKSATSAKNWVSESVNGSARKAKEDELVAASLEN